MSPERIIHIIQNVRHANPRWLDGYPLRLLTRPAARISTNAVVHEAIRPWLDPRSFHRVINLGHDVGYFRKERLGSPLSRPVRVAHTTWKSDIGDHVERRLDDDSFAFRSIRRQSDWAELRELYHWADVFLCAPNQEEGFYMPALEAMEAGCIVVTPDVGGNMAFCRPDENCVLVEFGDVDSYGAALRGISGWSTDTLDRFRRAASTATVPFDLQVERRSFLDYLGDLWRRIDEFESGRAHEVHRDSQRDDRPVLRFRDAAHLRNEFLASARWAAARVERPGGRAQLVLVGPAKPDPTRSKGGSRSAPFEHPPNHASNFPRRHCAAIESPRWA